MNRLGTRMMGNKGPVVLNGLLIGLVLVGGDHLGNARAGLGSALARDESVPPVVLPVEELTPVFDRLLTAVRNKDAEATTAQVDVPRLVREIERQQILSDLNAADRTAVRVAIHTMIGRGLVEEAEDGNWASYRLVRAQHESEGKEATAIVRLLKRDGIHAALMHVRLVKQPEGWKIYDWHDSSRIVATSTYLAVTLAAIRGERDADHAQSLMTAARLGAEGDTESADETLESVADVRFVKSLEAARWLLLGKLRLRQNRPAEAIACLLQARSANPEMPMLPGLAANAYRMQGAYERACKEAEVGLERWGPDALLYAALGDARLGLNQKEGATDAYRKGLACEPTSFDNLIGLGRAAGPNGRAEFAEKLERMHPSVSQLAALGEALVHDKDAGLLDTIVQAFRQTAPDDPLGDCYRAELMALKDPAEGAKLLDPALARLKDAELRTRWGHRFLDLWILAGNPVEAHRRTANPEETFAYLAERLLERKQANQLLALVEAHRVRAPGDLRAFYYAGKAYLAINNVPLAIQVLTEAMTKAPNDARDMFRQELVVARHRAGDDLAAYRELPPAPETFSQLAKLMFDEKKTSLLTELIALHREAVPDDPETDYWQAEVAFLRKDYDAALQAFQAYERRLEDDAQREIVADRILNCWLVSGRPVEGYGQASDKPYAFSFLAERLLTKKDAAALTALVAAHREGFPRDLHRFIYEGHALALKGDYAGAERAFTQGQDQAQDAATRDEFREAVIYARYKAGRAPEVYRATDSPGDVFARLAALYAADKDANGLQILLTMHMAREPRDASLPLWEAEVAFLREDYASALRILETNRSAMLAGDVSLDRFEDRHIRCLLRLKRHAEALDAARRTTRRNADPWYEALAHAAAGNVQGTKDALEVCRKLGHQVEQFYADPDLGPALRSPAMIPVRFALPPPASAGERRGDR